jgi:hypothetical protein
MPLLIGATKSGVSSTQFCSLEQTLRKVCAFLEFACIASPAWGLMGENDAAVQAGGRHAAVRFAGCPTLGLPPLP